MRPREPGEIATPGGDTGGERDLQRNGIRERAALVSRQCLVGDAPLGREPERQLPMLQGISVNLGPRDDLLEPRRVERSPEEPLGGRANRLGVRALGWSLPHDLDRDGRVLGVRQLHRTTPRSHR
jgi:hypothetical protein